MFHYDLTSLSYRLEARFAEMIGNLPDVAPGLSTAQCRELYEMTGATNWDASTMDERFSHVMRCLGLTVEQVRFALEMSAACKRGELAQLLRSATSYSSFKEYRKGNFAKIDGLE